jgi:hypothetical protein
MVSLGASVLTAAGARTPLPHDVRPIWIWLMILLAVLGALVGHWITGHWRGLLINDRNRISLSQLQMVSWTIIVLAAFGASVMANLAAGADDPGAAVPEDLWILMGISTTSLVGTPLVSSRKKSKTPTDEEAAIAMNTLADQGRNARALSTSGQLIGNRTMGEARWSDLFEAEEVSRAGRVDLSKVQMFYFTLILLATYAALVASALKSASVIETLPAIPESMVALLGISHAGYLTAKVLPEPE